MVLALYTYASGLRGTALIAMVKDVLIYVTVIAAVVVIPIELGGYGKIFASIDPKMLLLAHGDAHNLGAGFAYVIAGAGLGAGAVPLSARHHRHAVVVQPPARSSAMPSCCRSIPSRWR